VISFFGFPQAGAYKVNLNGIENHNLILTGMALSNPKISLSAFNRFVLNHTFINLYYL